MRVHLFALLAFSISSASQPVLADEPAANDQLDYRTSNLDEAIQAAQQQEEQGIVNEVGEKWYQKSTANSFPLPKMLNSEMGSLMIEGAISATAAGAGQIDANEEGKSKSLRDSALGRNLEDNDLLEDNQNIEFNEQPEIRNVNFFIDEASATTQTGTLIIRDARSSGVITATGR